MRVGIVGQIEGAMRALPATARGLSENATADQPQHPESSIRHEGQDGTVRWCEAGAEIPQPEWASDQSR